MRLALGPEGSVGLPWILAPVGVTGGFPQESVRPGLGGNGSHGYRAGNDLPWAHARPRRASLVTSSSLSLEA